MHCLLPFTGEDGRIKSAAGVGALLQDGIGDTIRVSLTEPPWAELSVCRFLRRMQEEKLSHVMQNGALVVPEIPQFEDTSRDFMAAATRGKLRLGVHPNAFRASPNESVQDQELQKILHRDGTAVVAISPQDLLDEVRLATY